MARFSEKLLVLAQKLHAGATAAREAQIRHMSAGLADNCARLAHERKRLTHPWGQPQAGAQGPVPALPGRSLPTRVDTISTQNREPGR
jgi:hypothetical protein